MSENLLSSDLWRLIGFKLDSVADRIRFRAVSKTWSSLLPARLPPWLVLSGEGENEELDEELVERDQQGENGELGEEHEELDQEGENEELDQEQENEELGEGVENEELDKEEEDDKQAEVSFTPPRRGFVSLGDDRIYEIDCPELHQARMIGSTGNWLITLHLDTSLRLINPFSKHQIHLPPSTSLEHTGAYTNRPEITPEIYRDNFVWKLVLSSPPSQGKHEHDFIAVAIHDYRCILALARPGDESWTLFQTPYTPTMRNLKIEDVVFYKQRFYAVDKHGKLMACDVGDCSNPPKLWYLNDGVKINYVDPTLYLVEWLGELLLVIRIVENFYSHPNDDYKTNGFLLYKLDSENGWNELTCLGEHSLFLGFNASISVLASDYFGSVKRNCIYFTDNYLFGYRGNCIPGGRDMGVFDLEDGSITPHFRGVSTSLYSPPVWIIPS